MTMSSLLSRSGRLDFDDLQSERSYQPRRAYGTSKLANLMFAQELDRRSREHGWGIVSTAAHPGATITNLQVTGPSRGRSGRLVELVNGFAYRIPGLWQQVDTGILPGLYAATSPYAHPAGYYGPDGFGELNGGVTLAKTPRQALHDADAVRLWDVSEQLTHVTFATSHQKV
jgi:NAD(P)-dependent dehydrogenase (short-subunit alcohol dehydrogenase family)